MTNETQEDIALKTMQNKSEQDDQKIIQLHTDLKTTKKNRLKIMILSTLSTILSTGILTAVLNGNDNTEKFEPTNILSSISNQGEQTTYVEIRYQKDGDGHSFEFSFNEDRDDKHPTAKYYIGNEDLDKYSIRLYDFSVNDIDDLTYDNYVDDTFDYGSFADHTELRDKIAQEALKAGFLEKTGLTELPNYFIAEKNTINIAPTQQVSWTIDTDGDGSFNALQVEYIPGPVPRKTEHVEHNISLTDNTYCTESSSHYAFNDVTAKIEEKCQDLDKMGKDARSKIFAQFNAQKLFDYTDHPQQDAVIGLNTEDTKTRYKIKWVNRKKI